MRRLLAVMVVVGLFTIGAGASAHADDSAVTKDQIKIGVSYVDLEKVRQAGIKRDHGDYQKAFQTVIDDVNAKGGVNGRKIVPVYAAIDPIGTDPAQEACVKLTEDDKVFAVIGQFQGDAPLCYVEQHKTPIVGGTITSEYLKRAKAPWYTLEAGDADTGLLVDALAKAGELKGKVGVVYGEAGGEAPLFENVVLPALKKNGISAKVAVGTAPPGDIPAGEAEADVILEKFKSEGVKTILGGAGLVLAAQRLAKTDYRPKLVSTNSGPLAAYVNTPGSDLSVVKNVVSGGVGYPYDEAEITKCRDKVAKATGEEMIEFPPPGDPTYRVSAETACRYVTLFAALAKDAGKNLTSASFGKAGEKAGSVDVPGSGTIPYLAKTHSFVQPIFLSRFDPAQKRFVNDPEPVTASAAPAK
jgi:ABC-type branched-subunit amino acid transport system substrate-binding protein